MTITVLLADDHKMFRDGLRVMLEKDPDMEVVGEAANGREAVELALKLEPDVIIMDVSMDVLNGVEATRQILRASPMVKVIGLSMHSDSRYVSQMLKARAMGYILKDCAYTELAQAVRTVYANETYLSPGIISGVVTDYVRHLYLADDPTELLTPREREVLQLLAEGSSTKEIAATLHISVKTVETHRRRVMEKLQLRSYADLVKYAIREGFTTLADS